MALDEANHGIVADPQHATATSLCFDTASGTFDRRDPVPQDADDLYLTGPFLGASTFWRARICQRLQNTRAGPTMNFLARNSIRLGRANGRMRDSRENPANEQGRDRSISLFRRDPGPTAGSWDLQRKALDVIVT